MTIPNFPIVPSRCRIRPLAFSPRRHLRCSFPLRLPHGHDNLCRLRHQLTDLGIVILFLGPDQRSVNQCQRRGHVARRLETRAQPRHHEAGGVLDLGVGFFQPAIPKGWPKNENTQTTAVKSTAVAMIEPKPIAKESAIMIEPAISPSVIGWSNQLRIAFIGSALLS